MKISTLKPVLVGGLVISLLTPMIPSYGLTVSLPPSMVSVNYPKAYQQKIDEVIVCLLEAEQEIYDQKTLNTLPKLSTKEKQSCREILKTKPYAHNLTFNVDFSKTHADPLVEDGELIVLPSNTQSPLTILDTPLKAETNAYTKPTETLEIALRLFQDLNIGFYGDLSAMHQENDVLDVLFLRLYNLLYELPKSQGHPLVTEFMKDIRDNFFRVSSSRFFSALVWFASEQNPDKELARTLLLYHYQIQYADLDPGSQVPDENLKLPGETTIIDNTPPLTDLLDTSFEDLDKVWENAYADAVAEEDKEDLGQHHDIETTLVSKETLKTYEVQNGVCMEITTIYENDKKVSQKTTKAASADIYRCGDSSLLGDINYTNSSDSSDQNMNPILSYRYGTSADWVHTSITAKNGTLTYASLSDLLATIATEVGSGYLQDQNRFLYILSDHTLYLEKYKEAKSVKDLNQWLADHRIQLEFGLNIEAQDEQSNFFNWLKQSN